MTTDTSAQLEPALRERIEACRAILRGLKRVVVAFSAGSDSTFLMALAAETLGCQNVLAAIGVSPSLPDREREAAGYLAAHVGVELVEVETCELDDPNYAANPADRCFYCKSDLFERLTELAASRGFQAVLSGANADDTGDFRPGIRAGEQLGVRSPLLEAALTKADVRATARAMGLATWDKPASACLSSRIPYGEAITAEKLARVEQAEYVLKDLGFAQCRIRDHGPVARVEVPPDQIQRAVEIREHIVAPLKKLGYNYVALDLQGFRSGSMNETLGELADGRNPDSHAHADDDGR